MSVYFAVGVFLCIVFVWFWSVYLPLQDYNERVSDQDRRITVLSHVRGDETIVYRALKSDAWSGDCYFAGNMTPERMENIRSFFKDGLAECHKVHNLSATTVRWFREPKEKVSPDISVDRSKIVDWDKVTDRSKK